MHFFNYERNKIAYTRRQPDCNRSIVMFKDHIPNELKFENLTQNVQSRSSSKKFHEILK